LIKAISLVDEVVERLSTYLDIRVIKGNFDEAIERTIQLLRPHKDRWIASSEIYKIGNTDASEVALIIETLEGRGDLIKQKERRSKGRPMLKVKWVGK